tara:strand:- start:14181 stop:15140 length:960 start_codon:yes stop_codon:yes gene_type:complete
MEKQAKLIEIKKFKPPAGSKCFFYKTIDGIKIRIAIWNIKSLKGTFIIQSGRTEFIEKYYEVVKEIIDRGYCVVMFDWRGQGLSGRLTKDKHLGHVDKFEDYDSDLLEIFDNIISQQCPQPYIGMGHSMGGCLMASFAAIENQPMTGLILCAPMLKLRIPTLMKFFIILIGFFAYKLGFKDIPLQRPEWENKKGWHEVPFEENNVTSDIIRYLRSADLIREDENLAVGGFSLRWIYEAIKRCDKQSEEWAQKINIPTLVLLAKKDKLVDTRKIFTLCQSITKKTIIELDGEHELLMERDLIRKDCWKAIDTFLETMNTL